MLVPQLWKWRGAAAAAAPPFPPSLHPHPPALLPLKTFHVCSADPEQVRLLNEANRAAAFAQASRAPGGSAAGSGGGGGGGGAATHDNWMCGTCRCLNLAHRDECGSCRRANPRGPRPTAITASTRGKDVLKCSDDEVIG